jgi:probable rRNA maturation factor
VISIEKAVEQAEEYGHPLKREIAFLTIHGVLHLLGYDHESDDERLRMRAREEDVLGRLGLARE